MRHYFCLLFLLFYTGNPLFTQITEYPELEGWKIIKKENYNPKTLFDHINGAADSYLKYEFQELTLIEYTKGDDYIISESYYHKNPSFAWGIYRSERPEEASFIKAGVEGYKEERSINFTAGSYYIKIYSNSEDNNIQNDMIQLADNMS